MTTTPPISPSRNAESPQPPAFNFVERRTMLPGGRNEGVLGDVQVILGAVGTQTIQAAGNFAGRLISPVLDVMSGTKDAVDSTQAAIEGAPQALLDAVSSGASTTLNLVSLGARKAASSALNLADRVVVSPVLERTTRELYRQTVVAKKYEAIKGFTDDHLPRSARGEFTVHDEVDPEDEFVSIGDPGSDVELPQSQSLNANALPPIEEEKVAEE